MKKFIYGIIIGVSNIIPGVCSASMAMTLGCYDDLLTIMGGIYRPKVVLKYKGIIGGIVIGAGLAIFGLNFLYKKFPFILSCCFLGMVLSGIFMIAKKEPIEKPKWWIRIAYIILGIVLVVASGLWGEQFFIMDYQTMNGGSACFLFLFAALASLALILPGISGALLLLVFGLYFPVLESIQSVITSLMLFQAPTGGNIWVLCWFLSGFLCGLIVFSKIMNKLLHRHPIAFYYWMEGLLVGSLVTMIYKTIAFPYNPLTIIIGVMVGISGFGFIHVIKK